MRVEIAEQTGRSVPQFIIYAENDAERVLLNHFVSYKQAARPKVLFWLHGWVYEMDRVGVKSFSFGYVYEHVMKPRHWWEFWK